MVSGTKNEKVRILFLAANPRDTAPLRLGEEVRLIEERLRAANFRDRFELEQHHALRQTDLAEYLLRYEPHIVHFSGHGSAQGEIVLEDNQGSSRVVPAEALRTLFATLKDNIRCVVLNACWSESQARAIAQEIDCVVGMSRAVGDADAIHFGAGFYRGLAYGRDVQTAFKLGTNEIDLSGLPGSAIPQLLTRSGVDAAQMFFVGESVVPATTPMPPAPVMPAIQGTQSVFISYSRANRDFVSTLIRDLQARNVRVWIDQQGLVAGTPDWEQALRDAIRGSSSVLLIASPASRQSRYVKDEIRIAEMYQRKIYPIWIEGTDWMDSIPIGMGGVQNIDARGDRYAGALVEIVRILGAITPTMPAEMPAEPAPTKTAIQPESEPEPTAPPRNPYKGLRSFTDEDAGDFFGRDKLVSEWVETLRNTLAATDTPRFMAVIVGPSGSGKSSVVMAGLLPKLRKGALTGSDKWLYLDPMVPGSHPLERLTVALSGAITERSMDSIREDLDSDSARGLHLLASRAVNIAKRPEMRLVLMVDQFEELFTLTTDEDERRHFIDLLVNAVTESRGAVVAILTLRADFYDRPMQYIELGKLVESASKSVLPMDIEDLRAVIEKPAALPDVRLMFDEGLVGDLLFEVRGEPAPLPLLQFTLDQLFERRDGRRLTRSAYQEIGGVKGALAKHAEATYAALPTDEYRRLARALFLRLIEPGVTEQDTTRRRAALNELTLPDAEQTRAIQQCANRFVNARLLTTDEIAGSRTIEVSHEALIREWARLGEWLREAREDIRLQQALSQDAADWQRRGKRPDDLYRGQKLIDAQRWAVRNVPSAEEMAFIDASAAGQSAAEQTERDRQARELELAKQAAENARRAEAAEKDRAVRFEEAARTASQRARIAGIVAVVAAFGIILAVIAAIGAAGQTTTANNQLGTATIAQGQAVATGNGANTQVAVAQAQIVTATIAQGQAVATGNGANTQVAVAGTTLTPIPPTLTAVSVNLNAALNQASTLQFNATISAFDQSRLSTLVPRIAQVPPTYAPTQSWTQKLTTATAIAAAYRRTPVATTDAKGAVLLEAPPGCFLMGDASYSDAAPVTEICFDSAFWIDKFDVTNKDYAAFVTAGGYKDTPDSNAYWTPDGLKWRADDGNGNGNPRTTWGGDPKAPKPNSSCMSASSADNQPVVCVTWYEAYSYCQWRGARLPTEAEYEYAARGPVSWRYPWGDSFVTGTDDDKAVYYGNSKNKILEVGKKPAGASWVGALDMSGNVWQWVSSWYSPYPYSAKDGRESIDNTNNKYQYRVLRGGSFDSLGYYLRSANRGTNSPDHNDVIIGFRCARSS